MQKVLNCFSPQWNRFQAENYFSATEVKKPPEGKTNILFCGNKVKGLEKLSVKDFAVLGDRSSLVSDLCMTSSVLGHDVSLNKDLNKELILSKN